MYPVPQDADLGGSSGEVVDTFAWTVVGISAGLVVLFALIRLVPFSLPKAVPRPLPGIVTTTPAWVIIAFICSYALLIPGLVMTLFAYDISAVGGSIPMKHATETMISFVHHLASTDAYFGASFVVLYAMVIPAAKILLLILTEVWRRGPPAQVMLARRWLHVLQAISKWAAPDMFAYVLLLYLLRGLNHPPLLEGDARLDVGFTCFAVFCVGSTVASLGVEMPPVPEGVEVAPSRCCGQERGWHASLRVAAVALLAVAFVPLLVTGLRLPSMTLSIDLGPMYEPNGPIPTSLKKLVESLKIEELAHAEVSFWRCLGTLATWTAQGEANSFIAFLLFAVCVVASTCVDMFMLLTAAVLMWYEAARPPATPSGEAVTPASASSEGGHHKLFIRASKVLKKLSFLDVAVVGVVVVVLSGAAYRKSGLVLKLDWGLLLLTAAELCHYVAYYLVVHAVPPHVVAQSREVSPNPVAQPAVARDQWEVADELELQPLPHLLHYVPKVGDSGDSAHARASSKGPSAKAC